MVFLSDKAPPMSMLSFPSKVEKSEPHPSGKSVSLSPDQSLCWVKENRGGSR